MAGKNDVEEHFSIVLISVLLISSNPQTGTMLWLVPVLLIAGAVLVAAGIIIKKKISK